MQGKGGISGVVVVAGIVAFGCLALAGALMIAPGAEATQRLGLFFAVIGTAVAALVALLKSDQAATQTNGTLDQRIEDGVHRALAGRRATDTPIHTPTEDPPA